MTVTAQGCNRTTSTRTEQHARHSPLELSYLGVGQWTRPCELPTQIFDTEILMNTLYQHVSSPHVSRSSGYSLISIIQIHQEYIILK